MRERESERDRARDRLRPIRAPQLRTPRAAGVAGVIFSVLMVVSYLLMRFPPADVGDAETRAWFEENATSSFTLVALYLVPFAGVAFLWFIGVVRARIGRHEDRLFSTVFLGTGLLFIAMFFAGMAMLGGLAAGQRFFGETGPPDAHLIRFTRWISATFFYVYGTKMAGVFVLVTDTIAWRTRIFSRWVALIGYAVALVLIFYVGFNKLLVTIFPAWVMFLSVYLIITHPKFDAMADDEEAAPD